MEEIKRRIRAAEARQLDLRRIMAQSDAHMAKCQKLELDFAIEYPDDLAEYKQANADFAEVEKELAALYLELAEKEKEEAERRPSDMSNL